MEFNKNYDSSNGVFPLEFENSEMEVTRTEFEGGKNAAYENGYLYVVSAKNGGSLRIFSCDSEKPVLKGEIKGIGNTRQIEVSSDAAFRRVIAAVTSRECGLYLIDVTNPEKPFICYHYNTVEFATGVAFGGKYLAVGSRSFGVELLDISNPENPRHICAIRAGEVQSVFISGKYLYTGSWCEKEITVIDISNANNPKTITKIPLEGRADGVYVKDGILYAAFGQHKRPASGRDPKEEGYAKGNGFAIWDVRNVNAPKQLSRTFFPYKYYCCNFDMWDIKICGHYAIVSHTFNGVWVYDISDLTNPVLIDQTAFKTDVPMSEIVSMNDTTLNLRPMIFPFDLRKESFAPVTGIAVGDKKLYITMEYQNLHIAEADYFECPAKPSKPDISELGQDYYTLSKDSQIVSKMVKTCGQAHAVINYDGYVYVACGNEGIGVYDENLKHLNQISVPGIVMDICEKNGYIFVAAGKKGIVIFKPSGENFKKVSEFSVNDKFCAQIVPSENGKFLMVHTGDQDFSVLDVSDTLNPFVALTEHNDWGLVYHRQMSFEGVMGKYYGFYWNGNICKWYDLSKDNPLETEYSQGNLTFYEGVTGLNEPYNALAITKGGYVIADIRENKAFSEYEVHAVGDMWLKGKPVVKNNILYVSDRMNGIVTVCDISDINSPKLILHEKFAGYPDIVCPVDDGAIIPLGYEGIAKISF